MIQLHVNGELRQLDQPVPVAEALQHWGYHCEDIAVAINSEFVPRSQYAQRRLEAKDCVDIVAPVQGG